MKQEMLLCTLERLLYMGIKLADWQVFESHPAQMRQPVSQQSYLHSGQLQGTAALTVTEVHLRNQLFKRSGVSTDATLPMQ